jgi:hypothetical protein
VRRRLNVAIAEQVHADHHRKALAAAEKAAFGRPAASLARSERVRQRHERRQVCAPGASRGQHLDAGDRVAYAPR